MDWLGMSLSFWERVFFIATVTAAIAGGISVIAAAVAGTVGWEVADTLFKSTARQIADANARVSEATESAAKANAQAAEANRVAEQERLERTKLEAAIAPRSLSLEQQEAVAKALTRLKGVKVAVVSYSTDLEAATLGRQVIACLKSAGISAQDNLAGMMPLGGFAIGVHLQGPDMAVARSLAEAFASHGGMAVALSPPPMGASVGTSPPNSSIPAATVLIGVKPIPTIK